MSRQSIQNTLSDNIDLQNKSLQGRMFCESIINCLKGDEDFTNISQPYNNTDIEEGRQISQEILKIQNIPLNIDLSTQKSQVDLQQYQKNERNKYTAKTNSNILKQKSSIKNMSKLTETQQKFNNIKNQSIPNSVLSQLNYDKMKVELRSIDIKNDSRILLGQCKNISDLEVSNLQESYINSEITHIKQAQYHSERINEGNYERAVNIIKNILSKSMNRVQRINKHVNNFIQILKDRKNNRTITNLLENEYRLINDQAFSHRKLIRRNFPYRCLQKLCCFDKIRIPIPLFMPTNIFRIYWDILQTIYTYLFIYIYSILIFFAMQDEDTNFIKQYYLYTFIFFLVDTLVTLNTAFFKKDAIITNRKQIAWKYFSSSIFITDAISLITMGSKLMSQNSNLVYNPDNSFKTFAINLLVFFKLKCVNQKKKRFSYAFTLKDNQKHIMKLFNQLLSVVFVAHLVSLAWYTLGQYEIQNGYSVTWISKNNLNEIPYIQLYIYSMYWSVTTMTTGNCNSLQYFLIIFFSFLVGYGDISATNYVEALFITCSMILFSCVFAYSINNIGFILQEIEKSSKELNDSIIIIQRYLIRKNVNTSLQSRVRHYLSFLAKEQKDRNQQSENQILQVLSNKLRNEIVVEINSRIIKNNAIFSANFSSQILRKLVFIMEEVIISPNEVIFEEGDYDDQSVYFIESGQIEIYQTPPSNQIINNLNQKSRTHTLQVLSKDSIFGEISFFSGLARNAGARSINLSTLYRITRTSFINLISENTEDFERFKMMEEQIKIQQDNSVLYQECYGCKCMGHLVKDCPKIHQKFDSQFLVLKHNFSLFQERQGRAKRRFSHPKYNPRINLYDNQTICQVLKENIRHINSEIEILFKTNESDLYQSSNYDEKFQGELMSTSNQTSQSSLKGESSNKSINEKQLFKSDRSINSTQKDHQASNSLKLIKFVKQPSHQKSQRDSLKDNKIIENLENLLQSERQNSGLNNNTINNKSVHATQNINQFEEDQQIFVSVGNNQHCKENLDKLEKNIEDLKDQINLNSEQIENQNVQGKPHNSKISNNLRLSSSTNRDSSNKSIQESNEDKGKIRQTKLTIKFNPNNQEDCNISNQSCQSEEDAQKQNQGSAVAFKKQKTKSNQQSTKELRSSIDNQVYNGIYSAYVAQSLALISAQSQINKFESTVNKLDEKIQTIYDGKSLSNFERNSFLYNNKRNTSSIFSNLSKRQFGSYEQRASLFQEIDSNTIKKCDKQNSSKRVSYKNKNSVEVFGQNSEAFNEQSQSQKILQRFCKMINGQADEYFRSANQKSNSQTLQNQDFDYFILDLFDIMKNYKKFFPHNNFINILNYNNVSNIKLKKKVNSSKSTKKRRQNIFIQQNSARKSIFCNQIFQQSQFSEIEYEKYKPTFLSYGVQQITESKFPKYQNDISLKIL
ncbi:hypothetical protein ABPG73_007100 [Tetrahymena malaccensis]